MYRVERQAARRGALRRRRYAGALAVALGRAGGRPSLLWTTPKKKGGSRERVHYGPLDVEDLGRVYEALLELEPGIAAEPMCRLRRQKLEVVVPVAQGEKYRPPSPAGGRGAGGEGCLDLEDGEPPIGLILCAGKSEEQVRLLRLGDAGIRVDEYLTELPPQELLQRKLHDAMCLAREQLARRAERPEPSQLEPPAKTLRKRKRRP